MEQKSVLLPLGGSHSKYNSAGQPHLRKKKICLSEDVADTDKLLPFHCVSQYSFLLLLDIYLN